MKKFSKKEKENTILGIAFSIIIIFFISYYIYITMKG